MKRLLWLALVAVIGCDSGEPPVKEFQFAFHPPDSTSFTVTLSLQTIGVQGDQRMGDSTWTRTQHTQVATEDGYRLTGLTDSVVVYHNGELITDPVVQIFTSIPLTYLVDTNGGATDVIGYAETFANLDTWFSPDTVAMIKSAVNPEVLRDQGIETWNAKFQPFVGRRMTIGSPLLDTSFPTLPIEGSLARYEIVELVDTIRIDSKLCGKLLVTASTNPTELAQLSGHSIEEIVELFGLTDDEVARATLRQAGSSLIRGWVLEFETMLSHSESQKQELFFNQLDPSGQPIHYQRTEIQSKQFIYTE